MTVKSYAGLRACPLNHVGPFDVTLEMIKVITSLPGGYVLPYLDHQTFADQPACL